MHDAMLGSISILCGTAYAIMIHHLFTRLDNLDDKLYEIDDHISFKF